MVRSAKDSMKDKCCAFSDYKQRKRAWCIYSVNCDKLSVIDPVSS